MLKGKTLLFGIGVVGSVLTRGARVDVQLHTLRGQGSLPARSMRCKQPWKRVWSSLEAPSTRTVSTLWLRLLRSFMRVSATALFAAPVAITSKTSSVHSTASCGNIHVGSFAGAALLQSPNDTVYSLKKPRNKTCHRQAQQLWY